MKRYITPLPERGTSLMLKPDILDESKFTPMSIKINPTNPTRSPANRSPRRLSNAHPPNLDTLPDIIKPHGTLTEDSLERINHVERVNLLDRKLELPMLKFYENIK
jgi:hypothetical protein